MSQDRDSSHGGCGGNKDLQANPGSNPRVSQPTVPRPVAPPHHPSNPQPCTSHPSCCDGSVAWRSCGLLAKVLWSAGRFRCEGLLLRPRPDAEDGVSLGQQDAPRILISCWRSAWLCNISDTFILAEARNTLVPSVPSRALACLLCALPAVSPPAPVCFPSRPKSRGDEAVHSSRGCLDPRLLAQQRRRQVWRVVVTWGMVCNSCVCRVHNHLVVYTTPLQCTQLYNSR